MNVLAISGSLREASINSAFCRAAAQLAPAGIEVTVFSGLGSLPLFNPDLEARPPVAVNALREAVAAADALLVASPEYAHGISGPLKNALDWLVSFEGTVGKPVALVNTSPRARHAHESLREVLLTMATVVVPEASISIPLLGGASTEQAMLDSSEVRQAVLRLFAALSLHLSGSGAPGPSFRLA
jgi:chromate reductase, NAD(P)H dehydrogenase (quinone)